MAFSFTLSAAGQTNTAGSPDRKTPGTQVIIRPMPPEIGRRSESLHASLQPPARIWVKQQAEIEARRPALDLDALRGATRRRFAGSLPAAAPLQAVDIDAVVFTVLTETAQDQNQELQNQMQQMQAMEKEKQALRQLLDQIQQEIAQTKAGERGGACQTPFCRALPARLGEMTSASATLPRPFYLSAPDNVTYPQLSSLESQTKEALGSASDMSEEQQIQVQTLMDQRAKLLETLSNMLKSMSDTSASVVSNMK
jgi:hypothetical protein